MKPASTPSFRSRLGRATVDLREQIEDPPASHHRDNVIEIDAVICYLIADRCLRGAEPDEDSAADARLRNVIGRSTSITLASRNPPTRGCACARHRDAAVRRQVMRIGSGILRPKRFA
jgi:hypothetical protein